MAVCDIIGYLAAALVLVAFYQRQMVPLRIAALGSNVAFLAYGLALGLMPVWLLHAVLLPLNARRLFDAWTAHGCREGARREPAPEQSRIRYRSLAGFRTRSRW